MLITHRKFPVLERLERNDLGNVGYYDVDKAEFELIHKLLKSTWKKVSPLFNKRIRILSKPFYETFNLAKDRLNIAELYEQIETQSGTIIIGDTATCYAIEKDSESFEIVFYQFFNEGIVSVCESITYEPHVNKKSVNFFWATKALWDGKDRDSSMYIAIGEIMCLINFFRYAQVETKILPANKKIKEIDCKYVNQTKSNVEYLNSTWFTNLVKSEGFKVRGHFRLQPCGVGMKERRLIWVADFQKTGYTAPARKTKEFPAN